MRDCSKLKFSQPKRHELTMRILRFPSIVLAVALASVACASDGGDVAREPGEPLPGLTEEELGRFLLGKAVFDRLTTPEEGLGPLFNQDRCSSCHDLPTSGGSGVEFVTKATRWENGVCNLLVDEGGDNIQQRATPLLAAHGITRETMPPSATARVEVAGPALFGLGLVELIPDEEILSREDPDDADGDGISGRAGRTADGRVGRFGRKLDVATVFDFNETALRFELGLTTPMNPVEETVNGVPIPADADPVPDPEIDLRGINLLTDFVRFLAPSVRGNMASAAVRDTVERGEQRFDEIGCTSCHVPSMRAGPSDVAALDRKTINLYSDMLLHDLGPELGDVCGLNASPSEYRTALLLGLRFRTDYMHDDRASSLRRAVLLHEGEATRIRDAFERLTVEEQGSLLRFLSIL